MGRDLLIVPERDVAEHAEEIQVPGHVCLKESVMLCHHVERYNDITQKIIIKNTHLGKKECRCAKDV